MKKQLTIYFLTLLLFISGIGGNRSLRNAELFPMNYHFNDHAWQEQYEFFPCDRMPVMVDGKIGYVNSSGEMVIPPIYESVPITEEYYSLSDDEETAKQFSANGYAVVIRNGRYGLIDTMGNIVIPTEYDDTYDVGSDVLFAVKLGEEIHLIDRSGNTPKGLEGIVYADSCNLPGVIVYAKIVEDKNLYGLFLDEGNRIIPAIYDGFSFFSDGNILAYKGDRFFFMDHRGDFFREATFSDIDWKSFTGLNSYDLMIDGLYRYGTDPEGNAVLLDSEGNLYNLSDYGIDCILPHDIGVHYNLDFCDSCDALNEYSIARFGEFYGLLDGTLRYVIPPIYNEVYLAGSAVIVEKGNHYSILTISGEKIMDLPETMSKEKILGSYKSIDAPFFVCIDDRWAMVDANGQFRQIEEVMPERFNIGNRYLIVGKEGYGIIKNTRDWIVENIPDLDWTRYETVGQYHIFINDNEDYSTLIDSNGTITIEDDFFYTVDFLIRSWRQYTVIQEKLPDGSRGKLGVWNGLTGEIVVPMEYDSLYPAWHSYGYGDFYNMTITLTQKAWFANKN